MEAATLSGPGLQYVFAQVDGNSEAPVPGDLRRLRARVTKRLTCQIAVFNRKAGFLALRDGDGTSFVPVPQP